LFPSTPFLIEGALFNSLEEPVGLEGSHQTTLYIVRTIALPVGPSECFVDRFQIPRHLIKGQVCALLLSKNLDQEASQSVPKELFFRKTSQVVSVKATLLERLLPFVVLHHGRLCRA
jgi:hypothetical protein